MKIKLLEPSLESKFEVFLLKNSNTTLYASKKYRDLLAYFLKAEPYYFVAIDSEDNIIGILPSFLKKNESIGNVLNSLPFYGSNGGVISLDNNEEIYKELIAHFYNFANDNQCLTATIISSPFEERNEFYEKYTHYDIKDERIGQITPLQQEKNIMDIFHYKTRNVIRKAQKENVEVEADNSKEVWDFLFTTHEENIKAVNGIPKSKSFFDLINIHFEDDKDFKIYTAKLNGKKIAALLCLYYNKTVEYFTPVIVEDYRNYQPLSLLIYEAMQQAISKGYINWNWGGTWLSQDGVYRFKKKWGTIDIPYYYYTKILDNKVMDLSKQFLLENYPYFFVIPFNKLAK